MTIEVAEVAEATPEVVAALQRLVPQLSSSSPPPTEAELAQVATSPATTLLVARRAGGGDGDGGDGIVGSLTLASFRIPTGLRAWIEDVVVDQGARGAGVGEALLRHALALATGAGARSVDLTSRPSREAANRLYRRVGFKPRETNVWRYDRGA